MSEQEQQQRPDTLAPTSVAEVSLDDEAASMNKGKGRTIVAFVLGLGLLIGGVGFLLKDADASREYRETGQALNGIKKQQFDRFWGCALRGTNLKDIKSNADLVAQMQRRTEAAGRTFAVLVRDNCMDALNKTEADLDVLLVPGELQSYVTAMRDGASQVREGWGDLIAYLINPNLEYEQASARKYWNKIAKGWYGFRKGHSELNRSLRERLK